MPCAIAARALAGPIGMGERAGEETRVGGVGRGRGRIDGGISERSSGEEKVMAEVMLEPEGGGGRASPHVLDAELHDLGVGSDVVRDHVAADALGWSAVLQQLAWSVTALREVRPTWGMQIGWPARPATRVAAACMQAGGGRAGPP
jgi:hypothetical protein